MVERDYTSQRFPAIDLFAGAGGLAVGAEQAGCEVRLSVDSDPWSCATLRANHHHPVHEGDLAELSGDELRRMADLAPSDPLIVLGGPPCQPFSKAAYWVDEGREAAYRRARAAGQAPLKPESPAEARPDDRRSLVQEFWRLVVETNADGFVFENVRSITHPRHRPVLERLVDDAKQAGFRTTLFMANAAEHGVPQRRQRVFVMGSRTAAPEEPVKTHVPADKADESGLAPFATAGPALMPFSSSEFFEPEEVVTGRWADHLRTVPPGGNYKAHTEWGGHPNPTFVTETRYWNFLLKLSPDLPSWTINASPGPWTGPFHWESRRLRTVELAALQTFPEGYRFEGSRRERVRQIGNAVPPMLASAVVEKVIEAVRAGQRNPREFVEVG
jgi:DNA (cytosine-5)-methyltransferase 1